MGQIVTQGYGGPLLVTQGYGGAGSNFDLKQAIVAALEADAAFTGIVGANLYPTVIPQTNVGPAVGYWFDGSSHVMNLRGAAGLRRTTVIFEFQAPAVSTIEALRELVRNRMQGLIGALSGLAICYVFVDPDEVDDYYEPIPGSDLGTHNKKVTYTFTLRESLPTHS